MDRPSRQMMVETGVFHVGLAASDKATAILQMVRLTLQGKGYTADRVETIANEVLLRGGISGTGGGFGFANPHCRTEVDDTHFGLFTFTDGVHFEAVDNQPVFVATCLISRTNDYFHHILLCDFLMRILEAGDMLDRFRSAESSESLRRHFAAAFEQWA